MFDEGRAAMLLAPYFWNVSFPNLIESHSLGYVPFPKDPQADQYYVAGSSTGFFVPVGASNIQGLYAFVTSCVATFAAESVEGSEESKLAKAKFLNDNAKYGITEEDFIERKEWQEFHKTAVTTIPSEVFVDIADPDEILAMLLGGEGVPAKTYAQIMGELEPVVNMKIEEIMAQTNNQ